MTKFFIAIFFLFGIILLGTSCANMIPPGGGPRDSIPPVLIKATPGNFTLNFSSNKIVLHFNEYVTVDNPSQNLLISPYPVKLPAVESKLQTIEIKLKDSLEANTTYTLNFGNAIKDINEGNIAREFKYAFSTGVHIDSAGIAGKVILAETGGIDSTLIVVLHENLSDTAVVKLRPKYYTKLNGQGRFVFHNLPPDSFAVYVIPNDYSKKYDDSTKLFAFLNNHIKASKTIDSITLYSFREVIPQEKKATSVAPKNKKSAPKHLLIKAPETSQDLLGDLPLILSNKLKSFDSSKFVLYDTSYKRIGMPQIIPDTVLNTLFVRYKWTDNAVYNLVIDSSAITDTSNMTLAISDTIVIKTRKTTEYGTLRLYFGNINFSNHYVLQLYQYNNLVKSIPITSKEWRTKLFSPGDYEMHILIDSNNNGIWDTGRFADKKQPEKVILLPKKLSIKSNWDNISEINFDHK